MSSWNFVTGGSATLGPAPAGRVYKVTGVTVSEIASAPQSSHYYPNDKPPATTQGPGSVMLTVSGAVSASVGPAPQGTITWNDSTTTTQGHANGNSLNASFNVSLRGSDTVTASYSPGWVGNPTITFHYTDEPDIATISYNSDGGPQQPSQTVSIGSTINLPSMSTKTITISYNYAGGTPSEGSPSSVTLHPTFAGWFDGSTYVGGSGASYTVTKDVKLTAHWNPASTTMPDGSYYITISFNYNTGSGHEQSRTLGRPLSQWTGGLIPFNQYSFSSDTSLTASYGSATLGELPIGYKEGYVINGWTDGNTPVDAESTFTASTTLTAHWICGPLWIMTDHGWIHLVQSGASPDNIDNVRKDGQLSQRVMKMGESGWYQLRGDEF